METYRNALRGYRRPPWDLSISPGGWKRQIARHDTWPNAGRARICFMPEGPSFFYRTYKRTNKFKKHHYHEPLKFHRKSFDSDTLVSGPSNSTNPTHADARRPAPIRYTALMGILIGMDEAGYGPNLGPLVVAVTAWHYAEPGEPASPGLSLSKPAGGRKTRKAKSESNSISCAVAEANPQSEIRNPKSDNIDLYRSLRTIVSKTASDRRIAIADSKSLYTPGQGLRQLERGLHSVLRSMHQTLTCWPELIDYFAADPDGHHKRTCWPDGHNCALPIDAENDELSRLEPRFTRACESAQVRPLFIRARLVFPAEFNDLVDHYGTKGAALSHITVGLLREIIDKVAHHVPQLPAHNPLSPTHVVCDKHGGRNFYAALLQHHFSGHWIEPIYESHTESRYEWGPSESRTQVSFRMQGERFLPTALASMTAKYLRELSMRAFNEFWCARVPNLRPTAGYPKDAQRFRKAIAATQKELKIDDRALWRNR